MVSQSSSWAVGLALASACMASASSAHSSSTPMVNLPAFAAFPPLRLPPRHRTGTPLLLCASASLQKGRTAEGPDTEADHGKRARPVPSARALVASASSPSPSPSISSPPPPHSSPTNEAPVKAGLGKARRAAFCVGFFAAVAAAGFPANAQRPPPMPKMKSIPQECLQSGACGGASQSDGEGLPAFQNIGGTQQVLDPKGGKYTQGLKVQDLAVGDKDKKPVQDGATVSLQYVLRRSNGYFVDASFGFDRFDTYDFKAGTGAVVPGFDEAIRGMYPGGRRRFVLPPELGYTAGVSLDKPGPIPPGWGERRALDSHRKEPLIFEVLVQRVK